MDKRNTSEKIKVNISIEEFKNNLRKADLNTFFIFGSILLVLAVGLYALFSPDARNDRLANPACGKIVVASTGPSLNNQISPDLAVADYFLIINPLTNKLLESSPNPYQSATQPTPDLAYLVAGKGEEAVIAGRIDPYTSQVLAQFGVRSFGGYSGKVKNAVTLYRQARIAANTVPVTQINTVIPRAQTARPVVNPAQNVYFNPAPLPQQTAGFNLNRNFICPNCNRQTNTKVNSQTPYRCPNCQTFLTQGGLMNRQGGVQTQTGQTYNIPAAFTRGAGGGRGTCVLK